MPVCATDRGHMCIFCVSKLATDSACISEKERACLSGCFISAPFAAFNEVNTACLCVFSFLEPTVLSFLLFIPNPKNECKRFPIPQLLLVLSSPPYVTFLQPFIVIIKISRFQSSVQQSFFFFFLSQQEHDSKVAYSSDEYNFPLLLSLWLMTVALLSVNIHCLSVSGPGIRLTEKWLFPQDCQAPDWYKVCFYKEEDKGTLSRLQSAAWERSLRKKEMWSQLKTKSQESLLSL